METGLTIVRFQKAWFPQNESMDDEASARATECAPEAGPIQLMTGSAAAREVRAPTKNESDMKKYIVKIAMELWYDEKWFA
jgi:hypothetical protein